MIRYTFFYCIINRSGKQSFSAKGAPGAKYPPPPRTQEKYRRAPIVIDRVPAIC